MASNEVKLNDCLVLLRDTDDAGTIVRQMRFLEYANIHGIEKAFENFCNEQIFTEEYQF